MLEQFIFEFQIHVRGYLFQLTVGMKQFLCQNFRYLYAAISFLQGVAYHEVGLFVHTYQYGIVSWPAWVHGLDIHADVSEWGVFCV